MRRTGIMIAALVLVAGVAHAGDYHTGATLICNDCHTIHASMQHSYGGGTTGFPMSWTPTTYLLKGPVNSMCLACHDDDGAPDVFGTDSGYFLTNRSAGALNNPAGDQGYLWWQGHTLDTTLTAPGGTWNNPDGLNCVDCHHQHGYAGYGTTDVFGNPVTSAYRNLRYFGGKTVSYATGTNDTTMDVYQRFSNGYETSDTDLNEPVSTDSGFATWCKECHGDFHGAVGGPEIGGSGAPPSHFVRHPSASVDIGALGGGHSSLGDFSGHLYRVKVMSPSGDWGSQGSAWTTAPADLTPTCNSCHKSHGNGQAFGLIYADGASPILEDGSFGGTYKTLCKQCHVQG